MPDLFVELAVRASTLDQYTQTPSQLPPERHRSDLRVQQALDGGGTASPLSHVGVELLTPRASQRVVLRAPGVLGLPPLRIDEPGAIQPFERGKERAGVDLEDTARDL